MSTGYARHTNCLSDEFVRISKDYVGKRLPTIIIGYLVVSKLEHLALFALTLSFGASLRAKAMPDFTAALHLNIQITAWLPRENQVEARSCGAIGILLQGPQ